MQINTRPHTPLVAISIAMITHPDTNTPTHRRGETSRGALKSRALGEKNKTKRHTHVHLAVQADQYIYMEARPQHY